MSKVAVVYWSGTGNTEIMASAVAEGVRAAGGEAEMISVSGFSADAVNGYDAIAWGCPAMGDEVLEESEFQPVWDDCKGKLGSRKIALFGSYGWGDGQWMRDWEEECRGLGAELVCDPVMANDSPDDEARDACIALGKALAF